MLHSQNPLKGPSIKKNVCAQFTTFYTLKVIKESNLKLRLQTLFLYNNKVLRLYIYLFTYLN